MLPYKDYFAFYFGGVPCFNAENIPLVTALVALVHTKTFCVAPSVVDVTH